MQCALCALQISISDTSTRFGALSRMRAADHRTCFLVNHTSVKMTANWIPPAEFHSAHSEVPQLITYSARTVQCTRRARVSAYIVHADRLRPLLAVLLQRMCARTAQHSMRRICAAAPSLTDEDECGSLGSPHRIPTPQTIPNRCGHPPGTTDVPRFGWMLRARWHGILDYTLSACC